MTSTRNKNTAGDYQVEQRAYIQQEAYCANPAPYVAQDTMLAGHGLIQGKLPDTKLSKNPNDIESFLFGIGSTNLVTPLQPVTPEINHLQALTMVGVPKPVIMPRNFDPLLEQRPYPV
tara:strand:+ start:429 stop:782 length:354 start_codon:yes stop_codon:yes gene_type:complete